MIELNCNPILLLNSNPKIDETEQYFLVYSNGKINIYSIETGQIVHSFPDDDQLEDEIINFASSNDHIVIAFKSNLIRLYEWSIDATLNSVTVNLIKTWRSQHKGPVCLIEFDSNNGNLIATGSSDGSVIIWDLIGQYITHFLKGCTGVVTTIAFQTNPTDEQYLICASGNHDNKLFVWNLRSSASDKLVAKFELHSSEITGARFFVNDDNKLLLLSVSRDKIACVYDMSSLSIQRTIPIYNSIASMLVLPTSSLVSEHGEDGDNYFITVGEKNSVDVWSTKTGRKMLTKSMISENLIQVNYLKKTNQLCVVTFDNNVLIYDLSYNSMQLAKQLSGNNEEVLDLCYLGDEQYLAVATNSSNLKIFSLSNFNCLIVGESHQSTVISVRSFTSEPYLFASCSKDKSFKLWKFNPVDWKVDCLFAGLGHNGTVSSIGLSNLNTNWIVTGSEDNTIKIWLLPTSNRQSNENGDEETPVVKKLISQTTVKAHEKGVNCIDVSPNDRLIVTCSNDKLAKLYKFDYSDHTVQTCSLEQLGTFVGHRRGVWSVRFSPVDQILATSSSDLTIKLWSLSDFSCLRTFEGHQNSVLSVAFLNRGMQLISGCSNGNLKLWTVKNAECLNTIDAHADKIPCFLINKQEDQLVTGSSDSEIHLWNDVTEQRKQVEEQKSEQVLRKSEVLRNLVLERNWRKAIKLAISLNQPFTTLGIFKEIDLEYDGEERDRILNELFEKLREDQLNSILNYTSIWNTNQKHAYVAQLVLSSLFKKLIYKYNKQTAERPNQDELKKLIQKLEPYTRKHYERYSKLFQSVTFFDFLYDNMKLSEHRES